LFLVRRNIVFVSSWVKRHMFFVVMSLFVMKDATASPIVMRGSSLISKAVQNMSIALKILRTVTRIAIEALNCNLHLGVARSLRQ
jgi:hypothetical protein